jgi:hypothetical protein
MATIDKMVNDFVDACSNHYFTRCNIRDLIVFVFFLPKMAISYKPPVDRYTSYQPLIDLVVDLPDDQRYAVFEGVMSHSDAIVEKQEICRKISENCIKDCRLLTIVVTPEDGH